MTSIDLPAQFGKYQLIERIAVGGMAEVFKAKSRGVEGFEKVLVIKRILPELGRSATFVDMFVNEAKIAVSLSHANIVQVFDLGKVDDAYYIAMEYVAGFDLHAALELVKRSGHPLPIELAVFVGSELTKALDYAHRRRDAELRPLGIVHRDVSPSNVIVSWEGEVKLTDFGIAQARHVISKSDDAFVKGKYAYMAPEQARGESMDARADLFAVGTLLYEALCGQNPFAAATPEATIENVRRASPIPIQERRTDVPAELASIVSQAMSLRPEDRQASASRLYEDLIQFLYASGRRVGALELGGYLYDLREHENARDSMIERTADIALRAAFDDESHVGGIEDMDDAIAGMAGETRRPIARNSSGPPAASQPSAERRDVAFVAVRIAEPVQPTTRVRIENLIASHGGVMLEEGVPSEPDHVQLIAIFGAHHPDGHEADAAARCALRLHRWLTQHEPGQPPQIAVHAGRVFVASEGAPVFDERYLLLLGEATGLLDADLGGAGPAISQSIATSLRTRFVLDAARTRSSIAAHVVTERAIAETYGRFVGRKTELRRVGEILAMANRNQLRLISLTGEAGIGKTRLVYEIEKRLARGQHDVGVYVASCPAHRRNTPYSAVESMIRVVLGADEFDDARALGEKILRLRELGLGPSEIESVASLLGASAGASLADLHASLRGALLRIAVKLSEDRLTVFAWDGVESMDEASASILDALLRRVANARILVLLSGRHGSTDRWSPLSAFHEVDLPPLDAPELDKLTRSRLQVVDAPLPLLVEIRTRSAGNPLFAEEYISALVAAGAIKTREKEATFDVSVASVSVPKSLRGLVASRIARLDALHRFLLQAMAIANARVTTELLAHVTRADLSEVALAVRALVTELLVVETSRSEIDIAHDTIAEVIRESLDIDSRKRLHRAVAEAIEAAYGTRGNEFAERLATHWREAGERARAIDYLDRAASHLESKLELRAAIRLLARAIALLGQLASPDRDRMLALYRRLGEIAIRGRVFDEGGRMLEEGVELADGLGREDYVARLCVIEGRLFASAGRVAEGRVWIERGRELARRLSDLDLSRDAALALAECDARSGQNVRALASLREALDISRSMSDVGAHLRCLIPLALTYGQEGDTTSALRALREAWELVGDHADRLIECELHKMEALVHYYARDYERCIEKATQALELGAAGGHEYEIAVNAHNLGETFIRTGDFKRAFASLQRSHEVCREHGFTRIQMMNQRALAFIDAQRFKSAEARERIVEAVRYAEDNGYLWDALQAKYMLAIADAHAGNNDSAIRLLNEVVQAASDNGHRRYVEDAEAALASIERGQPPMPA